MLHVSGMPNKDEVLFRLDLDSIIPIISIERRAYRRDASREACSINHTREQGLQQLISPSGI